jgi:tartrate-resistant acid phosphatase type 5
MCMIKKPFRSIFRSVFQSIYWALWILCIGLVTQAAEKVTTQPLQFVVIGDYGATTTGGEANERKVAEGVKRWKPQFIITTGDNNYLRGEASTIDLNIGQYYRDYILKYHGNFQPTVPTAINRFFPSLGNHDWDCTDCAKTGNPKPYTDYFELPGNERYYKFSFGNAEFFAIDSDPRAPDIKGGVNSKQAQWLEKELRASRALYSVVYFHHPPYSSGEHGSSAHMQWPFAKWGANLVLSGHDHTYERLAIDQIPYVVIGTSGKHLYQFKKIDSHSVVRDNTEHGFLWVEEQEGALAIKYMHADGKVIDQFQVAAAAQSGQSR